MTGPPTGARPSWPAWSARTRASAATPQAHRRVMRKHAAPTTPCAPSQMDGASCAWPAAWEDCLRIGDEERLAQRPGLGVRPHRLPTGDTLVTTERGPAAPEGARRRLGRRRQELGVEVSTDDGPRKATEFFVNGEEPTRRIVTQGGYRIQGTPAHRIKVVTRRPALGTGGGWRRWGRRLVPLQLSTLVASRSGWRCRCSTRPTTPATGTRVRIPWTLSCRNSSATSWATAPARQGHPAAASPTTDLDVVERIRVLGKQLFGLEPRSPSRGVPRGHASVASGWPAGGRPRASRRISPGVDHAGKGWTPRVPGAIRETNDPAVYAAFLRGLFEADGAVLEGVPSVGTASELFADDVRTLLLALGLPSHLPRPPRAGGAAPPVVAPPERQARDRLQRSSDSCGGRKVAPRGQRRVPQSGNRDRIHLPAAVWLELAPSGSPAAGPGAPGGEPGRGVSRDLARQLLRRPVTRDSGTRSATFSRPSRPTRTGASSRPTTCRFPQRDLCGRGLRVTTPSAS